MIRIAVIVFLVATAMTLAGCEQQSQGQSRAVARVESLEGKIGKSCTVHFRRDVLGVERDTPFTIDTGGIDGATITISGTLIGADDDWIILKQAEGPETWVPRGNILMLKF
jgi:hypothetical protein